MRACAIEAMEQQMRASAANPTGAHKLARDARKVLDRSRQIVAAEFGTDPGNVVFTGSGTEADNLAIFGLAGPGGTHGGLPVCSAIEHHAVLGPVELLGGGVVGVDARGVLDLDHLAAVLTDLMATEHGVAVVSVMLANNESGVIQPLDAVANVMAEICPDALLHTDAVQGVSWLDPKVHAAKADLLSISAHKFGGPQGVGALVLRSDIALNPILVGGGQERERRSGTQNVAGIASLAAALEQAGADRPAMVARVGALRDRLVDGLMAELDGVHESGVVDGDRSHKVAGSAHLCFEGIESEALLFLLERHGVFGSAASSCASGAQEPSHVLAAMGVDRALAAGSLRLSLGAASTDTEIDHVLSVLPDAVRQLRRGNP